LANIKDKTQDNAQALADTCIQCARHSYNLLSESWLRGAFAVFDYFSTHYLFSCATVLAVSSLLGREDGHHDGDHFEVASQFLEQLQNNGNYCAREFYGHINAMKRSMDLLNSRGRETLTSKSTTFASRELADIRSIPRTSTFITAGMALAEPSLQEFLAQPNLDIQFWNFTPVSGTAAVDFPEFPELWGDDWLAG
jgi:proline utilization trans-activator